MLIYDYKKRNVPLEVGDLIVEKVSNLRNKRIGEIVLIRGIKSKIRSNSAKKHDLTPMTRRLQD